MNKKGSAMVWAAVSMVIITILALGIITAGQAYALRSSNEGSQKQAYLTARSAVDSILSQLDGYTATGSSKHPSNAHPLIPASGSIYINDFDFPAEMGDCTVTITRESDTVLKVSAAAAVGRSTETVCARLLLDAGVPFTATETLRGFSINGTLTVTSSSGRYFDSSNSDLYVNDIQTSGSKNYSFHLGSGKLFSDIDTAGGKINGHTISFSPSNKRGFEVTPLPSNVQLPDDTPTELATTEETKLWPTTHYRLDNIWGDDTASYIVSSDTKDIETQIGGTGTYYFKVTAGSTFYLNLVNTSTPTVYVFLDESAELVVNGVGGHTASDTVKLFLIGGQNSKITTTSEHALTMSGAIAADDITLGGSLLFTYAEPSSCLVTKDIGGSGGGSITSYTDTWRFDEYAAE